MIWFVISIGVIMIIGIVVKIILSINKNPDSALGILEHPSTFEKPDIEMLNSTKKTIDTSTDSDYTITDK